MKIALIIVGIVALLFIGIQIYMMSSNSKIETYPYMLVKAYESIEIRNYEATLFTSVKMETNDYDQASSKGFSILAGYIFGGNESNEKIAMTSPVTMSLEDSMTMMFMVPKNLTKELLPTPNQSEIKFKDVPAKTVAAISFGGWANTEKIDKYKEKLKAALHKQGISYTNRFYFLGYNAPFELLNRRNEVIVELESM